MKTTTLSVLAGLGTLVLAPSASAGFTGVKVTSKDPGDTTLWEIVPNARLFVSNIYATFDTRDGDLIFAVALAAWRARRYLPTPAATRERWNEKLDEHYKQTARGIV